MRLFELVHDCPHLKIGVSLLNLPREMRKVLTYFIDNAIDPILGYTKVPACRFKTSLGIVAIMPQQETPT